MFTKVEVHYVVSILHIFPYPGSRIGHRSLMRYYKQKFGVSRQVVVSKNQKAVGRLLQQYKALGWTGGTGKSTLLRDSIFVIYRIGSVRSLKLILHLTDDVWFKKQDAVHWIQLYFRI
ncbi:hypothetical protein XELAEV_18000405mg [Xenopus laevis]|uniref:Uncharacterized protein n=1 Tax=Xenopus laevis TaxID=8355 RepID=A0A974BP02_XENLA|nr:hypothetical protein XELAEV_18000405mg [Xenopus laevis]